MYVCTLYDNRMHYYYYHYYYISKQSINSTSFFSPKRRGQYDYIQMARVPKTTQYISLYLVMAIYKHTLYVADRNQYISVFMTFETFCGLKICEKRINLLIVNTYIVHIIFMNWHILSVCVQTIT